MAENINALILPIGADASQFEKSIKEVKDALKSLQKEIAAKPFNLVTDQQINQLRGLESTLEQLQNRVNKTNFNEFNNSSKDARTATTNLNLALQDLPFGFIGIQNNLPGLFSAFQRLREESKGTTGALTAMINELKGPAGLFLAFTAATTVTTILIQKFGSLSNAYDALFTSTSNAAIAQRNYNKELKEGVKNLGGEISKVDLLAKGIANENLSREERLNYFYQAKKELPELIAGLNEENILTKNGIKILQGNAAARKSFLDLQVKQQAIGKVLNENYSEEFDIQAKLAKEENNRNQILDTRAKAQDALQKTNDPKSQQLLNNLIKSANNELDKSINRISGYNDKLGKLQITQSEYSDELDGIIKGSGEYNKRVERLTEGLKNEEKAANKTADAAKKLAAARAEQFRFAGDIRSLRNQDFLDFDPTLKPIKKVDAKAYIESFSKSISDLPATNINPLIDVLFPENQFKELSDAWGKINKDTAPKLEEFKNQIRDALINKELSTGVKTTYDDVEKAITEAIGRIQTTVSQDSGISQRFQDAANKGANEFARLKEEIKQFEDLQATIEQNLTRPFRDFFDDLLENGKVAFDNFEKLVKDSLKRILAQAIATGLAQLFASLLSGGATTAVTKLAAGAQISKKLGDLSKIGGLFTRVAAPSFGGVGGGAMQMAGAVNLTLRGSDLVGSINRTNATISRVG
jgi:DNA repair exonuclease SbcCD ATPase subunit